MSNPSKRTWPLVGGSIPPMMLMRVLFPEPLGPIRATNSPGSIFKFTPLRTSTASSPAPNCFVRFLTSMIGISKWLGGKSKEVGQGLNERDFFRVFCSASHCIRIPILCGPAEYWILW